MIGSWGLPPTGTPVPSSVLPTVRVVIADRLPIFRDALRATLEGPGGFAVVGEAGNGNEAIRRVHEHRPQVLLLDLAMPPAGGLDVLRQLRDSDTGVHTAVLADKVTSADVATALTLGARSVLTRDVQLSVLYDCLRVVAHGNCWSGSTCIRDVVNAVRRVPAKPPPTPAGTLTPREVDVIAAVTDGAINRDIGVSLKISEQTVKNHLNHVFDKLGVSSRLELALYWVHRTQTLQRPVTGLRN
jgi:DNA-binding NarL/FixJ family response regulator